MTHNVPRNPDGLVGRFCDFYGDDRQDPCENPTALQNVGPYKVCKVHHKVAQDFVDKILDEYDLNIVSMSVKVKQDDKHSLG